MRRAVLLLLILIAGPAAAQEPGEPGRFIFERVEAGILRLDTHTGAVSLCAGAEGAVACTPAQDSVGEAGRDDRGLGDRLAALEARVAALEAGGGFPGDAEAMDRVAVLAERMMRQFFDMVGEMRREFEGEDF